MADPLVESISNNAYPINKGSVFFLFFYITSFKICNEPY